MRITTKLLNVSINYKIKSYNQARREPALLKRAITFTYLYINRGRYVHASVCRGKAARGEAALRAKARQGPRLGHAA